METYKRICIKDHKIEISENESLIIKRGKEYLTSFEIDNTVTIFTKYWIQGIPVNIFAGEQQFTK